MDRSAKADDTRSPSPAQEAAAAVEAVAAPALVFAVDDAAVLAANALARAELCLPAQPSEYPLSVDAAMPALRRLRVLRAPGTRAADAASTEPLVFWTAHGALLRDCRLRALSASSVLVQWKRIEPTAARALSPPPAVDHTAAVPEDLQQILRRLAHEMRTPLSAIVSMAEIVRDERLGADAGSRYREYAANIHDSARHLLTVVGGMLDPAAAGSPSGRGPPTFVEVDVGALLGACCDTTAPLAAAAGLTLVRAWDASLPRLVADAGALRQIVLNLLTNALKFTPRGGSVTVSAAHQANGEVVVRIADTGIGMSATEIDRFQSRSTAPLPSLDAPRPGGGLGLGLPIVGALAGESGARIEIDSVPGRGTTVTVAFAKSRTVIV